MEFLSRQRHICFIRRQSPVSQSLIPPQPWIFREFKGADAMLIIEEFMSHHNLCLVSNFCNFHTPYLCVPWEHRCAHWLPSGLSFFHHPFLRPSGPESTIQVYIKKSLRGISHPKSNSDNAVLLFIIIYSEYETEGYNFRPVF